MRRIYLEAELIFASHLYLNDNKMWIQVPGKLREDALELVINRTPIRSHKVDYGQVSYLGHFLTDDL